MADSPLLFLPSCAFSSGWSRLGVGRAGLPRSSFSVCFRGAKPLCPLKQKEKENINERDGSLVPGQISCLTQLFPSLGRVRDLEMPQGTKASWAPRLCSPSTRSRIAGFASCRGPWQHTASSFYQHMEKCLPPGFPSLRVCQGAVGLWNIPSISLGLCIFHVPQQVPAAISSSHSPNSLSFSGVCNPAQTIHRGSCALHFVQHPPKWLLGSQFPLPAELMLDPLHRHAAV